MSILDKVKEIFGGAKEKASGIADSASSAAGDVTDRVKDAGSGLAEKANELKDKATGAAKDDTDE